MYVRKNYELSVVIYDLRSACCREGLVGVGSVRPIVLPP